MIGSQRKRACHLIGCCSCCCAGTHSLSSIEGFFAEQGLSDVAASFITEGYHDIRELADPEVLDLTAGPRALGVLDRTGAWDSDRRDQIFRALSALQKSCAAGSTSEELEATTVLVCPPRKESSPVSVSELSGQQDFSQDFGEESQPQCADSRCVNARFACCRDATPFCLSHSLTSPSSPSGSSFDTAREDIGAEEGVRTMAEMCSESVLFVALPDDGLDEDQLEREIEECLGQFQDLHLTAPLSHVTFPWSSLVVSRLPCLCAEGRPFRSRPRTLYEGMARPRLAGAQAT